MDFLTSLAGWLGGAFQWAWNSFLKLLAWSRGLVSKLSAHFGFFKSAVLNIWHHLHGLWTWLQKIKTSKLWLELKAWYARYQKWVAWYDKHVVEPIRRIEAIINNIYQKTLGPVINALNAFRQMWDAIFFWNHKLAAAVDAKIFALENTLAKPFAYIEAKLNQIATFLNHLVPNGTALNPGLFQASLDANIPGLNGSVSKISGEGLKVIFNGPKTAAQTQASFDTYSTTGGGEWQPDFAQADKIFSGETQ